MVKMPADSLKVFALNILQFLIFGQFMETISNTRPHMQLYGHVKNTDVKILYSFIDVCNSFTSHFLIWSSLNVVFL